MKKLLLIILLINSTFCFSQIQIGSDIVGDNFLDSFGESVSMSGDGNIVVIGATGSDVNGGGSGQVKVFENVNGTWLQVGSNINGDAQGDQFGVAVSISSDGQIIAISGSSNDGAGINSGHVKIYENNAGIWTQIGSDIRGINSFDFFGNSVSLNSDGSVVAISARSSDINGLDSGYVQVFKNDGGVWNQVGSTLIGETSNYALGLSVHLNSDGNFLVVGAGLYGTPGAIGRVRVYENVNDVWVQVGSDIDGESSSDLLGESVYISPNGQIIAVGIIGGGNIDSGIVKVFENNAGVWTQIGQDIVGENSGDQFGQSIDMSSNGNIIAIGGIYNDEGANNAGHVRIYKIINGIWTQVGQDIDGTEEWELFGISISLNDNGNLIAIGGSNNGGTGVVKIYSLDNVLSLNNSSSDNFKLYPNPANSQFTVQLKKEENLKKVIIYNQLGQFIYSSKKNSINIENLPQGLYLVEVLTNNSKSIKKLLID